MTTDSEPAKPANDAVVTTDSATPEPNCSGPSKTASASEPYRELIEVGLSHGRNAMSIWQELVDRHGFSGAYESVKRYIRKVRATQLPEARAIVQTAPARKRRWITAAVPWSATRAPASIAVPACLC